MENERINGSQASVCWFSRTPFLNKSFEYERFYIHIHIETFFHFGFRRSCFQLCALKTVSHRVFLCEFAKPIVLYNSNGLLIVCPLFCIYCVVFLKRMNSSDKLHLQAQFNTWFHRQKHKRAFNVKKNGTIFYCSKRTYFLVYSVNIAKVLCECTQKRQNDSSHAIKRPIEKRTAYSERGNWMAASSKEAVNYFEPSEKRE